MQRKQPQEQRMQPPQPVEPHVQPAPQRPKGSSTRPNQSSRKALQGTLEAVLLNDKLELIERLPVSQLAEKLQQITGVDTVVLTASSHNESLTSQRRKNQRMVASRISEAVKPAAQR